MKRMISCLLWLSPLCCTAQDTEPSFVYQPPGSHKPFELARFLAPYHQVQLERECLNAFGTFRFRVSAECRVTDLKVTGNLPDSLVSLVKRRLDLTGPYWVFREPYDTARASKWFVLPYSVNTCLEDRCTPGQASVETMDLFLSLFRKHERVITTSTSYLFFPASFFAMR